MKNEDSIQVAAPDWRLLYSIQNSLVSLGVEDQELEVVANDICRRLFDKRDDELRMIKGRLEVWGENNVLWEF